MLLIFYQTHTHTHISSHVHEKKNTSYALFWLQETHTLDLSKLLWLARFQTNFSSLETNTKVYMASKVSIELPESYGLPNNPWISYHVPDLAGSLYQLLSLWLRRLLHWWYQQNNTIFKQLHQRPFRVLVIYLHMFMFPHPNIVR